MTEEGRGVPQNMLRFVIKYQRSNCGVLERDDIRHKDLAALQRSPICIRCEWHPQSAFLKLRGRDGAMQLSSCI
jgi:hypothetical protein